MRDRRVPIAIVLPAMALLAMISGAHASPKVAMIEVKGMVRNAWPVSVATALESLPGVKKADVSLERALARVEFDDSQTTPEKLVAAIDRLGLKAKLLQAG